MKRNAGGTYWMKNEDERTENGSTTCKHIKPNETPYQYYRTGKVVCDEDEANSIATEIIRAICIRQPGKDMRVDAFHLIDRPKKIALSTHRPRNIGCNQIG